MMSDFDISAYLCPSGGILFKFDFYGTWKIIINDKKIEWERVNNEEGLKKKEYQVPIDIIRHQVYMPRVNYFVFKLRHPHRVLYILLEYDGTSASASLKEVSTSYKKILRKLKEEVEDLEPRYY